MQQLTIEDAERQWHIARLSKSMEKWRTTELDKILPEDYARYCATLEHLKAGGAYVVRDVTQELIGEMGRGICRTVLQGDARIRAERKAKREMVNKK